MVVIKGWLLYVICFTVLATGGIVLSENQRMKRELSRITRSISRKSQLINTQADSLVMMRALNRDLRNSFMVVARELESCGRMRNVIKEQSLLLRTLQTKQYSKDTDLQSTKVNSTVRDRHVNSVE